MFSNLSTLEKNFLEACLKEECRVDGRGKNEYRDIVIEKKQENGQVYVKLGDTQVLTQIFAKLVNPGSDRPNEGNIVFNLDSNHLRPGSEFASKSEDLNDLRIKITNLLEKSLRDSKALDAQTLCIVPGKLAWKIVVDVNILNNDGNIYDAIILSTFASWLTFKIPFLKKIGNTVNIPKNPQMINLTCLHIPFAVTFGLYEYNSRYILDPKLNEEKYIEGYVIISLNKFKEICYLNTYTHINVEKEMIRELIEVAKVKVVELGKILNDFINEEKRKEKLDLARENSFEMMDIDNSLTENTKVLQKDDDGEKKAKVKVYSLKSKKI